MRAIASDPLPPWPESIPAPLRRVLDRALARDLDKRYLSAAAMQEDLEHALAETRTAVTSSKIAQAMSSVLGGDFGRAPKIEATRQVVAWLRAPEKADTGSMPIPEFADVPTARHDAPPEPPRRAAKMAALALAGVALAALASLATIAITSGGESAATAAAAPAPQPVVAPPAAIPAPPSVVQAPDEVPLAAASALPLDPAPTPPEVPVQARGPVRGRGRAFARSAPARASAAPAGEAPAAAPSDFVDDPGF